jgi:preprotein translocase subunit SecD
MLDFPRWKVWSIILVLLLGSAFAAPNLLTADVLKGLPSWMPKKQLALGLDLQGGSYMLLQVDTDEVIRTRLDALEESARSEMRQTKGPTGDRIGVSNFTPGPREMSFVVRDPANVDAAVEAMRKLRQPLADGLSGQYDFDVSVVDGNRILLRMTDSGLTDAKKKAVEQSLEVMRKRIDGLGTKEADITRQGNERIKVEVPGLTDARALREVIGKTAKLEFKMQDTDISPEDLAAGRAKPGTEILKSLDPQLGALVAVQRRALISGENLIGAEAEADTENGGYRISFRLDTPGARAFGRATSENIGKPFAIVLDGEVISAPRIISAILGGSGVITGNFDATDSAELAALLRAGALPAKLTIVEERSVGPGLGKDSIEAGKLASLIGTGLVIGLMVLVYGRFGLFATVALLFNVVLVLGALTLSGATLTLPGIAGLVLTVGTAVDANVLIFERIREELRGGRTPITAVESGFREASRAIFDANITNVIAAIMMFWFGSGPIKGFAVVLSIGIVTSVFTGVTVCRLITAWYMRSARPQKLEL